jgi:hypothetical protein
MKLWRIVAFVVAGGVSCVVHAADELTGDKKLACEAILCLSSGQRPSECDPSLQRYFNIKKDKWSDTKDAREDFLNQCPSSKEEGMQARVKAIASGAGRCDADYLNATLKETVEVRKCGGRIVSRDNDRDRDRDRNGCSTVEIQVISSQKPQYCKAYADDPWTYKLGVRYVGDKYKGGHWVDG